VAGRRNSRINLTSARPVKYINSLSFFESQEGVFAFAHRSCASHPSRPSSAPFTPSLTSHASAPSARLSPDRTSRGRRSDLCLPSPSLAVFLARLQPPARCRTPTNGPRTSGGRSCLPVSTFSFRRAASDTSTNTRYRTVPDPSGEGHRSPLFRGVRQALLKGGRLHVRRLRRAAVQSHAQVQVGLWLARLL